MTPEGGDDYAISIELKPLGLDHSKG